MLYLVNLNNFMHILDFASKSVLERVGFGLKYVLHRVWVSWCCTSMVIQFLVLQSPRIIKKKKKKKKKIVHRVNKGIKGNTITIPVCGICAELFT